MAKPNALALWMVLVVSPALFPLNMLISRLVADWLPPISLTFWRWLLTALFAGALVIPQIVESLPIIRREWRRLLLLGAIGMSLCGVSAYEAGISTTTVNIALIYASSPVMMVLMEWATRKGGISLVQSAGIALCLLGVMSIAARGDVAQLARLQFVAGDLWALSGAVGWAAYSYLLRHMPTELKFSVRLPALCLAGAIVIAPFATFESYSTGGLPWTKESVAMLAFLVLVASYGSYVAYAALQRMTSVSYAGLAVYVSPFYAALYGWLFVDESLQGFHLFGAAMVLAGVWLASRPAVSFKTMATS
ncbi:MAG: DMT family transporter [Burkholderiales bacterium]